MISVNSFFNLSFITAPGVPLKQDSRPLVNAITPFSTSTFYFLHSNAHQNNLTNQQRLESVNRGFVGLVNFATSLPAIFVGAEGGRNPQGGFLAFAESIATPGPFAVRGAPPPSISLMNSRDLNANHAQSVAAMNARIESSRAPSKAMNYAINLGGKWYC